MKAEDKIPTDERIEDLSKSMGISLLSLQIFKLLGKDAKESYTYDEIVVIIEEAERNAESEIFLLKSKSK